MRSTRTTLLLRITVTAAIAVIASATGHAQRNNNNDSVPPAPQTYKTVLIQPTIGLQTIWFNGDYPVSQDISPGSDRNLPLGGGIIGSNNGLHLGLEVIPEEGSMIRFPVSLDAFFLRGKTSFPLSRISEHPTKRFTITHTANIFSAGTGVTFSFFKHHTLYFSAEAKMNYIPSTTLESRTYVLETDETIRDSTLIADPSSHIRYGAYLKLGTQVDFFEPFLLDFSIGYGALNLIGRNTDPATGRNLMVVDNLHYPEVLLGYMSIGFSVVWKL